MTISMQGVDGEIHISSVGSSVWIQRIQDFQIFGFQRRDISARWESEKSVPVDNNVIAINKIPRIRIHDQYPEKKWIDAGNKNAFFLRLAENLIT